ncbi:hypothetical protein HZZ02_13915, partial [Streptococcus danieliae]|nr:hypothetical protein [Streptococcus danieliae]
IWDLNSFEKVRRGLFDIIYTLLCNKIIISLLINSVQISVADSLEHFDPDVVSQSIVRDIIHYTNQQTIPYLYTWDGVLTSLFQDRFRSQKAKRAEAEKTKEETDEVLRVFSDEMNDLEEENKRLTSKLLDRENELEYYKRAPLKTHTYCRLISNK